MKSVLVIGNRASILERLGRFPELRVTKVMALRGSALDRAPTSAARERFELAQRDEVIARVRAHDFDILVSHGCPIIFPVERITSRADQLLINIHPSLLPHQKGPHPVNGALLSGDARAGVSMHYISNEVDGGNIIHQESLPLTDDVDARLLYSLLFQLEPEVFETGMRKLISRRFDEPGLPMPAGGGYYRRKTSERRIDFSSSPTADVCRRARAFGVSTQGCFASLGGVERVVTSAAPVENEWILARYAAMKAGEVALEFDGHALVRTADGLVRVTIR